VALDSNFSKDLTHGLPPDGSSITFATKSDSYNHWLATLTIRLNRDWAWDVLECTLLFLRFVEEF